MGPSHSLFHFPVPEHGAGGGIKTSSFTWSKSQEPSPATFGAEIPVFSPPQSCSKILWRVLWQELCYVRGFIYPSCRPAVLAACIPKPAPFESKGNGICTAQVR